MAGVRWGSWRYVVAVTHFRNTTYETELGVGELRVRLMLVDVVEKYHSIVNSCTAVRKAS